METLIVVCGVGLFFMVSGIYWADLRRKRKNIDRLIGEIAKLKNELHLERKLANNFSDSIIRLDKSINAAVKSSLAIEKEAAEIRQGVGLLRIDIKNLASRIRQNDENIISVGMKVEGLSNDLEQSFKLDAEWFKTINDTFEKILNPAKTIYFSEETVVQKVPISSVKKKTGPKSQRISDKLLVEIMDKSTNLEDFRAALLKHNKRVSLYNKINPVRLN